MRLGLKLTLLFVWGNDSSIFSIGVSGLEVPRHELVDLRDRPPLSDALKGLREPGVWIDIIHFCGLQKRGDGCPGPTTSSGSCEQRILPNNCFGRMARLTMLE